MTIVGSWLRATTGPGNTSVNPCVTIRRPYVHRNENRSQPLAFPGRQRLPVGSVVADIIFSRLVCGRHIDPVLVEVAALHAFPLAPPLTDHAKYNLKLSSKVQGDLAAILD